MVHSQQQQPGKEEESPFQRLGGEEVLLTPSLKCKDPQVGSQDMWAFTHSAAQEVRKLVHPWWSLFCPDGHNAEPDSPESGSSNCGSPIDSG